jgi:hypothetical protein
MDVREARTRRRGFFLHSTDGSEPETHEHENPEGFVVRVRRSQRPSAPRQIASGGRSRNVTRVEDTNPQIRSGSVTGSRQRAHLPR